MVEALPELVWFALLLLCFALVYVSRRFVHALFQPLIAAAGHVPGLGGVISGALNAIDQSISSALGSVEQGIDELMGASWHATARLTDELWNLLKRHAAAIAIVSPLIGSIVQAIKVLIRHAGHLLNSAQAFGHRITALEHVVHHLTHEVDHVEKELGRGIEGNLHKRLAALEREFRGIDDVTIPGLRSLVNEAETAASTALADVKSIPFPASAKTWAEAVAVALPALGLEWLRCNSNPMNGNRDACGLWSVLSRLLGLAAFLTVAFDFKEFVAASDEVAGFIGSAVAEFEGQFPLALPPLPPPQ